MKGACGALLAAVMLAGCGGGREPTAAEKHMNSRFDQLDYTMGNVEISAPPFQENLMRLTRRYIALIREYADELGDDEVRKRLEDKAFELSPYCLPCMTMVDLEAQKY
jgi:hypothetical protein